MKTGMIFPALFFLLLFSCSGEGEHQRLNVLLILVDTVTADHLGCYGYYRNTSPTIDSLAASGMIFMNCLAQSSWTLPGMVSIYTGLSERSHRCGHYNNILYSLDLEMPTVSTILQKQGYSTAGFVQSEFLGSDFGMEKGYDSFWIRVSEGEAAMDSVTVDTLLSYFSHNEITEPFLATIHFYDPHSPYKPPIPFDTLFESSGIGGLDDRPADSVRWNDPAVVEHLEAMYDSEIRWTDNQLSRLFQNMREMGLLDNTLVIFIADHGEEFMEHGHTGHANNLYQETIHIPLIISGPGIEPGTVVLQNVGQFDVLPTILNYLNIPVPDHVEGINLFGAIPNDRIIPSSGVVFGADAATCLRESKKVMWFVESDSSETFDLLTDRSETNPLPIDSVLLGEVLGYWAWPCICTPICHFDSLAMSNKLRDLGYIR